MAEKNKKTFKMPHTFVIMMVIILFAEPMKLFL